MAATTNLLTISGTLRGLPASTTAGLHIHAGFSCGAPDEVGGHWYDAAVAQTDPWTTTYTSNEDGDASIMISVSASDLGYSPLDIVGHTIVVHSPTAKIACGVLNEVVASTTTDAPDFTVNATTTALPTTVAPTATVAATATTATSSTTTPPGPAATVSTAVVTKEQEPSSSSTTTTTTTTTTTRTTGTFNNKQ